MTVDELRALLKKCPSRTVTQGDLVTIRRGRRYEVLLDARRMQGSRKFIEVRAGWYLPKYTVDRLVLFRGAEVTFRDAPGGDPDSCHAPDSVDGMNMVITGAHYTYSLWLIPAEMFYPADEN